MTYLLLFYEFFKTGLFSIGGGLATIPFLKSIAQRYDWFSVSQLTDMIAVSESTPGPMGINMATFSGFQAGGVLGGMVATLSLVLPSYIIILIVSHFLKKFRDSPLVEHIFYGIRPSTAGLIAGAMFEVFLQSLFHMNAWGTGDIMAFVNPIALVLFAIALVVNFKVSKLHPILLIICGAIIGIVLQL